MGHRPPDLPLRDAVARWLEDRRERRRRIAIQLRLPKTTTLSVAVQHFGGRAGEGIATYEQRVVSPYIFHDRELEVEEVRIGGTALGSDSIALARAIADQPGIDVRFFTFRSASAMALRLEDPTVVGQPSDPDPIFFALTLLDLALPRYLVSLTSLDGDNEEALRVADELLAFAGAESWTTLTTIPIAGLDPSQPPITAGPVRIRSLSPDEAGQIIEAAALEMERPRLPGPQLRRPAEWSDERHVIEVRDRSRKADPPRPSPTWRKVVLALQLQDVPIAGHGFAYSSQEPDWLSVGRLASPVVLPRRPPGEPRMLSSQDLVSVGDLVDHIDDASVESGPVAGRVGLRRFSLGTARQSPSDALVDNVIALEALLLPGGEKRELGFRFAINGALYMGDTLQERQELKKQLSKLYELRSKLVHGGTSAPSPTAITESAKLAAHLARRGLLRALRGGWPTDADFLQLQLGAKPPS